MIINSKSNEKIKYINSLKNKKFRDKYNKYILEGIKLVDEYISSGGSVAPEFIVLSKQILLNNVGGEDLYNKVKDMQNILEVDEAVFNYLTDTITPQGILIVLDKKISAISELITSINNGEKFVILDQVSDAGNMGTIIRTAVSFNVKNIICIKGCTDVFSSKVIRSAMGALDKLKIYYLDYEELRLVKHNFKQNNYAFIGTDLKAKKYLNEINVNSKFVYVLGNEANGMSETMKDMCDEYVKIPMEDVQESLNVAIATSILLYDNYVRGNGNK